MKKKLIMPIAVITLAVMFVCITSFVSCTSLTELTEKDILSTLQNRYGKEFAISEKIDDDNYLVHPVENDKIVFNAGFREDNMIHPLIPAIGNIYKYVYDEYQEGLKRYWLEDKNTVWVLEDSYRWDAQLINEIYDTMVYLNEQLEKEGFKTTEYTSSFDGTVIINGEEHIVDFYKQEKSAINSAINRLIADINKQ